MVPASGRSSVLTATTPWFQVIHGLQLKGGSWPPDSLGTSPSLAFSLNHPQTSVKSLYLLSHRFTLFSAEPWPMQEQTHTAILIYPRIYAHTPALLYVYKHTQAHIHIHINTYTWTYVWGECEGGNNFYYNFTWKCTFLKEEIEKVMVPNRLPKFFLNFLAPSQLSLYPKNRAKVTNTKKHRVKRKEHDDKRWGEGEKERRKEHDEPGGLAVGTASPHGVWADSWTSVCLADSSVPGGPREGPHLPHTFVCEAPDARKCFRNIKSMRSIQSILFNQNA